MSMNIFDTCQPSSSAESLLLTLDARVVEWQTRTFEGRMPKGVGVQVPPRALMLLRSGKACFNASASKI